MAKFSMQKYAKIADCEAALEHYMNSKPRLSTYWVTCADGLEALLVEELNGLGVENIERFPGRLVFKGTLENAYRICMWSRLASRVLMPIHSHPIEFTHMHVMLQKNCMKAPMPLIGL